MRIELFDLRLFINVAEHSSLTKGAELSAISLPAASTRLKHLEAAAGVTLFTRTSHGVELTSGGYVMLNHARRISLQVDNMGIDLQDHAGKALVHIRLMATTIAMAGSLPAQIGMFINANPKAMVDISERRSTEIIRALQEGRTDIGLLNETAVVRGFEQHTFSREQLVLAVPKGHRFAARVSILFNETLDEHHINMPVGSSVGSALPEIAAAAGHERVFGTRVTSFESLCRLVEMGIGVGVLPQSNANRYQGLIDVRFIPLDDPWANIVVKLVAREDIQLPRLARELFDRLRTSGDAT
jgi:DNA-binding transcriptional LysR family regulator